MVEKESENILTGDNKRMTILTDRQTDRQTDGSVCLLHGRHARNRQENKQAERTVQAVIIMV